MKLLKRLSIKLYLFILDKALNFPGIVIKKVLTLPEGKYLILKPTRYLFHRDHLANIWYIKLPTEK